MTVGGVPARFCAETLPCGVNEVRDSTGQCIPCEKSRKGCSSYSETVSPVDPNRQDKKTAGSGSSRPLASETPPDDKKLATSGQSPGISPDLSLSKTSDQRSCEAGKICPYSLTITNTGKVPYTGTLTISDTFTPANASLESSGPAPWRCRSTRGTHTCTHPSVEIKPGASKILKLKFRSIGRARGKLSNCAELVWPGHMTGRKRALAVQQELKRRGFAVGAIDGSVGGRTRAAIRNFERKAGIAVTGKINALLLGRLFKASGAGDANAYNDKACTRVDLKAGAEIIAPRPVVRCSGGRIQNQRSQCVCPSSRPVWTGSRCIIRQIKKRPPPCGIGRVRNSRGQCVYLSCPPGHVRRGASCVLPACPRGQFRIGPICVFPPCPRGLVRMGAICVPLARPAPVPPPPPQFKINPRMLTVCPPGTRPVGGGCAPSIR